MRCSPCNRHRDTAFIANNSTLNAQSEHLKKASIEGKRNNILGREQDWASTILPGKQSGGSLQRLGSTGCGCSVTGPCALGTTIKLMALGCMGRAQRLALRQVSV